jgi:hypothetical protein
VKFSIWVRNIPIQIQRKIDIECGFETVISEEDWRVLQDALLAEYNAVYDYKTDMITFDSEADYTFFILRWS